MKKSILFSVLVVVATLLQAQSITVHQTCGQNGQVVKAIPDAVDLGLSVKWANMNVGATTPEDYGNYYAWGETVTKSTYDWSTYFYTNDGGKTFTKYNNKGGKTVLDPGDDAAHVNWGGSWRMPTKAECQELLDNCTWTWTTQNGINGCKVTSNKAGYTDKFIFLPAAGYREFSGIYGVASSCGDYLSSSLDEYYSNSRYAEGLYFDSGNSFHPDGTYSLFYYSRCDGLSVRPVLQPSSISHSSSANDTIRIYSNGCDDYQTFIGSHGGQLTMTANSDQWSHFVRWNDGNTDNPRTITINGNADYTAEFAKNIYSITKNAAHGTISGNSSAEYLDEVTLSVSSDYGYHFTQWSDGNTDNPRTIVLTQDTTFTAEFAKNTYTISTTSANPEWGTTAGDKSALYLDEVEISAIPNYGYRFVRWNDGNTSNPRIVSVTGDKTYTAIFAKDIFSITANAEHGSISGSSSAEYLDEVILSVSSDYGYHFTQWSDGNTNNPRTLVLTQDTTFTAEFAKNTYTISTTSANPEWGTTAGDTAALYLDEIEISAAPNYGYHFDYWNIEKYRELIDISSLYTVKFSVPNTWSNPYAWIWETGGQGHWETLSYEKGMYVYRTEQNNMNIIVVPNGPSWGNGQTNDLAITESCCYTISGSTVVKSYDCLFTEVQIDTITTLETHNPLSIIVASNQNATAKFAKNTYSITTNAEHGTISGNSSAEYLDQVTLSVSSDYGYHFTQWSDGNTENPRTFVLTRDTTFTAEFAIDKSGTCGKNNLLQWTFADDGTLTISGNGELTENYTFGVEAPTQMQQLVVGNEVTAIGERAFYEKTTLQKLIIGSNVTSIGKYAFASINNRHLTSLVMPAELLTIGDYAFSGNTYLESIDFNAKLQSIGAYAFKDCYRVSEMTCLATVTPNVGTDALASINSYASLCVPAECLRKYQVDPNWGRFDLCELGTTSTVTENQTVTVEPTDNTAIFTWPTENNAASYSLQITKDGVVFCTLVFNSNGQLTGIAFAPGRNGAAHAPAATMSVAGMSFTVTGLDGASKYAYRLAVTNDASEELVAYSGEFATTGYDGEVNPGGNPEGIEDVFTDEHKASKILSDGQIFILRGDKVYTLQGQEVK